MARPRVTCRGHRDKFVHRPAIARVSGENGAHGVGECNITTVECARAIAQLRNCQTDLKGQPLLRTQEVTVYNGLYFIAVVCV